MVERLRGPVVLALTLLAPVLLVIGGHAAVRAQPSATYDPVAQTMSTLAGRGATDPWIMIGTLVGMGLIYLLVAVGLRGIPVTGRLVLGIGAGFVLLAALARQPAGGSSAIHMTGVVAGATAFVLWPLGLVGDRGLPTGLRRGSLAATGVMAVALGWLCAQAWTDGTWLGVAERVLVLLQTVWPVRAAVASCWPGTDRVVRAEHATLALALLAPLVFAVGLVRSQAAQPVPHPETWSLSALAALGAEQRWIMTTTLGLSGVIYLAVAAGLRHLPDAPRLVLGLGGAMLVTVALAPQPSAGASVVHMVAGAVAWAAFATWPLGVAFSSAIDARRRRRSAVAAAVLLVLVIWFATQFFGQGALYGLSERIVFAAQCVWPIVLAAGSPGLTQLPIRVFGSPRGSLHPPTPTDSPDTAGRSS